MKYYRINFCALLREWERTTFCFYSMIESLISRAVEHPEFSLKLLGIFSISEKRAVLPGGTDQDFIPSGNGEGIILLGWSEMCAKDFSSDSPGL